MGAARPKAIAGIVLPLAQVLRMYTRDKGGLHIGADAMQLF